MEVARSYLGVREIQGAAHHPLILEWFAAAGAPWIRNDEAAWCSAFACGVAKKAEVFNPRTVRAKDWLQLPERGGVPVGLDELQPGDVCVVTRGNNLFHVAFFADRVRSTLQLLGGNQSNGVRISDCLISRFIGARRLSAVPKLANPQVLA